MEKQNDLTEEHLHSLHKMTEAATDEFFYTRLKARMEREYGNNTWVFPLKPIWIIGTMSVLLLLNISMISIKNNSNKIVTEETPSIKSFATYYDQSITSY